MKSLSVPKPVPAGARRARRVQAFTLPEMMVAVSVVIIMLLGVIFTWLFCLKWDELICSKLGGTEMSRMGFDQLTTDIRSAKWWKIGSSTNNGTTVSFTACTNMMNQVGNAIELMSTSATNCTAYVIYFFDTNSLHTNACWLCRWTNGAPTVQILAQYLTNSGTLGNGPTNTSMTFYAEKYDGTLAQDWQYKYAIVTTMEFCQYQYPLTKVGPGNYYDYYCIRLKAASHSPN